MTILGRDIAKAALTVMIDRKMLSVKAVGQMNRPEFQEAVDEIARAADAVTSESRRELREFVAWWMRIIHHDHRAIYPDAAGWQNCGANVCKSTAASFKDIRPPETAHVMVARCAEHGPSGRACQCPSLAVSATSVDEAK